MPKTILFTGGGSAGHVTPNVALIQQLKCEHVGWNIHYIGSKTGIEKSIIEPLSEPNSSVYYHAIPTGKLRREFNLRNVLSPFQVLMGIVSAFFLCQKIKPDVIFSKGGFVAFPVVFAGWLSRIPVIAHESDLTPGLANKMSFPFCQKICVTFPEGQASFGHPTKVVWTGAPVREALFKGDKSTGLRLCGFNEQKPVLMIVGGGLGADAINRVVREILPRLLTKFQVVHLCGKGKTVESLQYEGYAQFDYVNEEMPDIYACADIVVSRAGSNAIYELLLLKKPHVLIPLSYKASRGDQVVNAAYYEKQGVSVVLSEENMTSKTLCEKINTLYQDDGLRRRLATFELPNAVSVILVMLKA
jgi:UDP-N-acetylglucosamine--N-acetylmuramyl-(pentapeptide) pyrophosphoryl-undecaprenol N-acetylglucosamine transferase